MGTRAGNFTLVISTFLLLGSLYFIKSKSSNIALTTNIDAKVDSTNLLKINSVLSLNHNPIGKCFINDLTIETKSSMAK